MSNENTKRKYYHFGKISEYGTSLSEVSEAIAPWPKMFGIPIQRVVKLSERKKCKIWWVDEKNAHIHALSAENYLAQLFL